MALFSRDVETGANVSRNLLSDAARSLNRNINAPTAESESEEENVEEDPVYFSDTESQYEELQMVPTINLLQST